MTTQAAQPALPAQATQPSQATQPARAALAEAAPEPSPTAPSPTEPSPNEATDALASSAGLLAPLGLSDSAEQLYSEVSASATVVTDIDMAGRDADLAALTQVGLVRVTEDKRLVAIPIRLAVERWASEQESRIRRARSAASQFAALQRTTHGRFIELVRGLDQARDVADQLQRSAETTVLCFDREPYFSQSRGVIAPAQPEMSALGIKYQVVYQQRALEDPLVMAGVRQALELGEEARTYPNVPMRMLIADHNLAVVVLPYGSDPTDQGPTDVDALVVHPSALLDALVRTFSAIWQLAVPVGKLTAESADGELPEHRLLLRLLATGVTDASIARELGVSERTVHRRVTRLQQLLGANSRFLLGVQAVKRGWI